MDGLFDFKPLAMPNTNPIKDKDDSKYPIFTIPKAIADENLFVTAKTKMLETGWKLDLLHNVKLAGETVDHDADPDIVKLDLGPCEDAHDCRLMLVTKASRVRNGGEPTPPKLLYKLTFYAGNKIIDQTFEFTSSSQNPCRFYTKITLKIEE